MRKLFAIAGLLLLASVSARAQSSPGFVGGQLITADDLNKAFAMKQNYAAALYDLSTLATSASSNTLPYFEGAGAIGAASIGSGLELVGGVLSTTGSPGGVWTPAQGGTGVNNGTYTITLGGSLITGGALNFAPLTTAGDLLEVTAAGNVNQTPTGSGVLTALGISVNTTGGFGTVGTTGSNVGLLNANKTDSGNNTFSGTDTFSGTANISGTFELGGEVPFYTLAQFGAKGDALMGDGLTTTSGNATISGWLTPIATGRFGERIRIAGVGASGNPLDTTVATATTLAAAPQVTISPGVPDYYVSTAVYEPGTASGYQAGDILIGPAPTSGTVNNCGGSPCPVQVTIDAVSGGVPTAYHISAGGAYSNAQPFGTNQYSSFTGGHGSGIAFALAVQQAGKFLLFHDDTTAWENAAAAVNATGGILQGTPGAVYGVDPLDGLFPVGSAPGLVELAAGVTLDMNGSMFAVPIWSTLGAAYLITGFNGPDTIPNANFIQWPFPVDSYGSVIAVPNGVSGVTASSGAHDWIVGNSLGQFGNVAANIIGGETSGESVASNIIFENARCDSCVYGAEFDGGRNLRFNNVKAAAADRAFIGGNVQGLTLNSDSFDDIANDGILGGVSTASGGLPNQSYYIHHVIHKRVPSATTTGATITNSQWIFSVADTSHIAAGMFVSGTGIPTGGYGPEVLRVDGPSVMISQPATATATGVSLTFAFPSQFPAQMNSGIDLVGNNEEWDNIHISQVWDASGEPTGGIVVPLAFEIAASGGGTYSDIFNGIYLDIATLGMQSGISGNCSASTYANCNVNLFNHGPTWQPTISGPFEVSVTQTEQAGATNPGGLHVNMAAFTILGNSPLTLHDTTLLGAPAYENDNVLYRVDRQPITIAGAQGGVPWASYTPAVTCGTGGPPTYTATARYQQDGKTLRYQTTVNVTALNTCSGYFKVALPSGFNVNSAGLIYPASGWDTGASSSVSALFVSSFFEILPGALAAHTFYGSGMAEIQ